MLAVPRARELVPAMRQSGNAYLRALLPPRPHLQPIVRRLRSRRTFRMQLVHVFSVTADCRRSKLLERFFVSDPAYSNLDSQ